MDQQHSQAWDLIKQRQEYLDNLTAQATRVRAELHDLSKQVLRKRKIVDDYLIEAQNRFLATNPELIADKNRLSFEVSLLIKQQKDLQGTLDNSWSEHDHLLKMISHINKEAVALTEESRIESTRLVNEINGLKTDIGELSDKKIELEEQFNTSISVNRILKGEIEKEQGRLEKLIERYDDMEAHYKEKMVHNKTQLETAYLNLNKAISQLQDISSKDTQMRTDIANERMKLEQARVKSGINRVNPNLLEL